MIKNESNIKVIKKPKPKFDGRDEVLRHLDELLDDKVCGNMQINFYKGGISNWNVNVTYKPGDK